MDAADIDAEAIAGDHALEVDFRRMVRREDDQADALFQRPVLQPRRPAGRDDLDLCGHGQSSILA